MHPDHIHPNTPFCIFHVLMNYKNYEKDPVERIMGSPSMIRVWEYLLRLQPLASYNPQARREYSGDNVFNRTDILHWENGYDISELACADLCYFILECLEWDGFYKTAADLNARKKLYEDAIKSCNALINSQGWDDLAGCATQSCISVIDRCREKISNLDRMIERVPIRRRRDSQTDLIRSFIRGTAWKTRDIYGSPKYGTLATIANVAFQPEQEISAKKVAKWCTIPPLPFKMPS